MLSVALRVESSLMVIVIQDAGARHPVVSQLLPTSLAMYELGQGTQTCLNLGFLSDEMKCSYEEMKHF